MNGEEQQPGSNSARATTILIFQAAILLVSLAAGVIVARLFGPQGRGIYTLAFLPGQVLSALGAAGIVEATVYFISGRHAPRTRVLRMLCGFELVGTIAIGAVLALVWLFLGVILPGVPRDAFLIAAAATPAFLWMAFSQGYLFAIGLTARSQWPLLAERLVTLAGLVCVVLLGAGLTAAVVAASIGAFAAAFLGVVLIGRRDLVGSRGTSGGEPLARRMLAFAAPMTLAGVAQRLTYRLDQVVVNVIAGPTTVGLYGLSARLAELPLLIPRSLRSAWSASRARDASLDVSIDRTLAGGRRLSLLMAFVLPPYVVVGALAIPLIYGPAFSGSVGPFSILVGASFVLSLAFPFVSALTGSGRPRRLAAASWIGLLATIGLDIALVPSFGAVGAALASLGAYSTFALITFLLWRAACRVPVSVRALVPGRRDGVAVIEILVDLVTSRRRHVTVAVDTSTTTRPGGHRGGWSDG